MSKYIHLLETFKPNNYKLMLEFDKPEMKFSGTVAITGEVIKSTKELKLHGKELAIDSVSVDGSEVKFDLNADEDEIILKPESELNGEVVIDVAFNGEITKPMHGIYPCFFEHDGKEKKLIATQFESHHAREAFPCIDEPAAKATYDITLRTPTDETVLCNTPVKTQSEVDGLLETTFETTPIMSSYLMAFAFGDLGHVEAEASDGTKVGIWSTPDNVQHLDFALDVAVKTLDFYNDYFGIPFPLPKVDHIALPDFAAGAMENWGLITYRESALIVDKKNSGVANRQRVAIVIAHELAHQWFGNLVTMEWWTDLWLNEGFASWTEYLAIDKLFPDWNMWTQFIHDDMFRGQGLDSLASSHPVEVPINHPDDIRGIFDAISYSKGASVIRMLHGFMGPVEFQKGISAYLNKYRYGNARTADLWQALEDSSGKPVSKFMNAWTSQTGFPVVKVKRDGNNIDLEQERYYVNPAAQEAATENPTWPIALSCHGTNDTTLFESEADNWCPTLDDESILRLNKLQSGFYVVDYETEDIKRLAKAAREKKLPDEDRMGLINDAWMLARGGYSPTTDVFELLDGFEDEDSAAVWDVISSNLGLLKRAMGTDELDEAISPLYKKLACKQADRLGWDIKDSDSHFDLLLRPIALGMMSSAKDEATLKKIDEMFDSMEKAEDIAADVRGVVLVSRARRGDQADFDKLLGALRATQSSQVKAPIIAALTSFKQPEINKQAMELIKSDDVKLQEVLNWLVGIFGNRHAKKDAWVWLKDNWSWFVDQFGSDIMTFAYIPKIAASSMNTKEELDDYNSYCQQAHTAGINRQIEQGRETIEWQAAWRERDYESVIKHLKSNQ